MTRLYKIDQLGRFSSPVGQSYCRWRTALLLVLAGIVLGTLLVPVAEWIEAMR